MNFILLSLDVIILFSPSCGAWLGLVGCWCCIVDAGELFGGFYCMLSFAQQVFFYFWGSFAPHEVEGVLSGPIGVSDVDDLCAGGEEVEGQSALNALLLRQGYGGLFE